MFDGIFLLLNDSKYIDILIQLIGGQFIFWVVQNYWKSGPHTIKTILNCLNFISTFQPCCPYQEIKIGWDPVKKLVKKNKLKVLDLLLKISFCSEYKLKLKKVKGWKLIIWPALNLLGMAEHHSVKHSLYVLWC